MNLALGTVLLFLLIIPGIAFRSSYFYGPLTKKFSKHSAFDDFIWGIIPGVTFQLIGSLIVNACNPFGYEINYTSLGKILFSSQEAASEFGNIQSHLAQILGYNFSLIVFAACSGTFFRLLIRRLHLDHRFKIFRFNNEWFYLIKGEFKFFAENISDLDKEYYKSQVYDSWASNGKKVPLWIWRIWIFIIKNQQIVCTIHAVVKADKDSAYIYTGLLDSFYLQRDGSLDTIVLSQPQRRKFFDKDEPTPYDIPTGIIVLKNEHITNINVDAAFYLPSLKMLQSTAMSRIDAARIELNEAGDTLLTLNNEKIHAVSELDTITAAWMKAKNEFSVSKANSSTATAEEIKAHEELKKQLSNSEEQKIKASEKLQEIEKNIKIAQKNKLLAEAELKRAEADEIKI